MSPAKRIVDEYVDIAKNGRHKTRFWTLSTSKMQIFPARTPLGELTALPRTPSGEGARFPVPKNPSLAAGLRPRISALQA